METKDLIVENIVKNGILKVNFHQINDPNMNEQDLDEIINKTMMIYKDVSLKTIGEALVKYEILKLDLKDKNAIISHAENKLNDLSARNECLNKINNENKEEISKLIQEVKLLTCRNSAITDFYESHINRIKRSKKVSTTILVIIIIISIVLHFIKF